MTDQQATKLSQPPVGAFDDPAPFVATQFPPIFVAALLVVLPLGAIGSIPRHFHRCRS